MAIAKKTGVLDPSGSVLSATDETSWDWFNKYVERASFAEDVVTSQSSLILAGPALYSELSELGAVFGVNTSTSINQASRLTPIGFVHEFRFGESQPISRNFEIGSGRAKFSTGKSTARGSIRRAMFDADSLLKVLMRNGSRAQASHIATFFNNSSNFEYGFGLWSDVFKIPFGMASVHKTIGNDFVASEYLEQCYIGTHRVSVDARAALVMEDVAFEFDRVRPVDIRIGGPSGIPDNNT